MTITNGYATLVEAKSWIGLSDTDDDSLLELVITSVSRWIDTYCGRHFWQDVAKARVRDSCDGLFVELGPYYDLVSVTTLKTDSNQDGSFDTTWAATDYQLLPRNVTAPEPRPYTQVHAVANQRFPIPAGSSSSIGLVEITGTWGWPAVPAAVTQACRMQVSRILKRKQSPEGVAGWGEFGPMRISGRLDPDVEQLLKDYCHSGGAVFA